jgi:hypothetical protein
VSSGRGGGEGEAGAGWGGWWRARGPRGSPLVHVYVCRLVTWPSRVSLLPLLTAVRSACTGEGGDLVMDPVKIARRYASTWCLIDVLSTFPWDVLFCPAGFTGGDCSESGSAASGAFAL